MKNEKTMKLKWAIVIALATLVLGAFIGSSFDLFDSHQPIKIIGDDLEYIGEEGGAYQYRITAYYPENNAMDNISFTAYDSEGKIISCRFTKIISPDDSEYGYVCGEYQDNVVSGLNTLKEVE